MDDPDIGLMLRVKDGDEEAFRLLFRKHGPRVRQFVRRQVGDGPVADELVQDVFTQLFEARRRYRPTARFTTWLYTIAHNVCRNERRRREHQLRVRLTPGEDGAEPPELNPVSQNGPTGEESFAGQELESRIRVALERLPESQRSAVLLNRVDGLAYRDIAKSLGCTEGAVKALLFRATQSLKRDLRDVLGDDAP
jgi:RNA polymerase sigma-70 factor (ECF subfamily)